MDTRVGTTLAGKYLLESLIAVGGMASVYQGRHRNGHRVAVKVLHPELAANDEIHARFLREGRVANRIGHPGATRVIDDDTDDDGLVFLVMDLLVGDTLDARVARNAGPLPADEVAALAWQLLDTLIAAHAAGVIHRDIKPDNLFLTQEGILKVLDFGIAQVLRSGTPGAPALTRAGLLMGTPAFLPPEQALGRSDQIDERTDLWAVGASMFWLLSGRYVHEAATIEELVVYAGSQSARSIQAVAPSTPRALAAVIDRALAFDKNDRWTNAHEMQDALARACSNASSRPLIDAPSVVPSSRPVSDAPSAVPSSRPVSDAPSVVPSSRPVSDAPSADAVVHPGGAPVHPGVARRGPRAAKVAALLFLGSCALAFAFVVRPLPRMSAAATETFGPPREIEPGKTVTIQTQSDLQPQATTEWARVDGSEVSTFADAAEGAVVAAPARAKTQSAPRTLSPRRLRPVSCTPPYTVDAIGRRIPKPECL